MKITKRIFAFLLSVILISAAVPAAIAPVVSRADDEVENAPRFVYDTEDGSLISESDRAFLLSKFDSISETYGFDVVGMLTDDFMAYTHNDIYYNDIEAFADDYFDYRGYGYGYNRDGAIFIVSLEGGYWHISTRGYGLTALNDDALEHIEEVIMPYLRSHDFKGAFSAFADECDDMVAMAKEGHPYVMPKAPFNVLTSVLISIAVALIIALIITGKWKGELKSVRFKDQASDYLKNGSFNLALSRDSFLYETVTRTRRASSSSGSSSSHRSSSGASHGGRGGRF